MTALVILYKWCFRKRREQRMSKLEEMKKRILADGTIDDAEVAELRKELFADGKIDREEADLLVALRDEAKQVSAGFENLFYDAIKQFVLGDGQIDADEAAWLRKVLLADGKIDAAERKLLNELHTQARQVSPEFQQLFDECMKK